MEIGPNLILQSFKDFFDPQSTTPPPPSRKCKNASQSDRFGVS